MAAFEWWVSKSDCESEHVGKAVPMPMPMPMSMSMSMPMSTPTPVHPGDRVRAVDGLAGVVVEALSAEPGRQQDFVLRMPGGDLLDAPGVSVIAVRGGVVWLAVAAGSLSRHSAASRGVVPGARARR